MRVWGSHTKPIPRGFPGQVHAELTGLLRQHCPVCDERHLVLLGWMITGLLLSQTVCFDQWKRSSLPLRVQNGMVVLCLQVARTSRMEEILTCWLIQV